MPVKRTTKNGEPAYQYGSGKKYTYTSGNEAGRKRAEKKATDQGRAMHARRQHR